MPEVHLHEVDTVESSQRPVRSQASSVFAVLFPQTVEKLYVIPDVCYDFSVELPSITPFICAGEEMKSTHRIRTDLGLCLNIAVRGA
jgi:hypothetical protein